MSQVVGGLFPVLYFSRKNSSILRLGKTRLDGKILMKACVNGTSEFMSNVSMNLVGMLYNVQLMDYAGENGVAAYGVMMYVSMIFCGAFIGYSIGTAPIVSFHYGAQNHRELQSLLKKSLILVGIFSAGMTIAAELITVPMSRIFVGYDSALMALTVTGFRIFSICFLFMGYAIFGSGFFTALSDGLTSAFISFLRTMVFQIAAVILLPLIWGIDGIWFSVVVAELMAAIFCGVFLVLKRKKYQYF
jgi:Na+-driven multidrug efflux pump